MKLRNRLIAFFCLLAFAGIGILFFRDWVVQKPFAVIIFVGDGLSGSKLAGARLYENGASDRLELEGLPNLALLSNRASDFAVPDSASAATAIASGQHTSHRTLGTTPDGKPIESLLDRAIKAGRATGIVTNGALYDNVPASFYAHLQGTLDPDKLIAQLADDSRPQVLIGGGAARFLPQSKEGARADSRDILLEMRQKGYVTIRSRAELESTAGWTFPKVLALFAQEALPNSNSLEAGGPQPSLSDMVRNAIGLLQYHRKGYFLVVDAGLIERAAGANQGELTLVETLELNRAIQTAREYAGDKALIIATGKQSIGGMALNGYPLAKDSGMALLGTNAAGIPSITWATGPNGPKEAAPVPADPANPEATPQPASREPAAHYTEAAVNTAEDVIAVGVGPGSENLKGFMDTTDLFGIIDKQL